MSGHDRLLIFPISLTSWVILTQDEDLYIEDYRLDGRGDISRLTSLGLSDEVPTILRGALYRFDAYPSEDKCKQLLRDGYGLAAEELGGPEFVRNPAVVLDHLGVPTSLDAIFKGTFVARRARGKKAPGVKKPPDSPVEQYAAGRDGLDPRDGAATPPPPLPPPRDPPTGWVWVTAELTPSGHFGAEVTFDPFTDRIIAEKVSIVHRGGHWIRCSMVMTDKVEEFRKDMEDRYRNALQIEPPPDANPAGEPTASGGEDVRTLFVDYDEQGVRWKIWRQVVKESTEFAWPDSPTDGPATVLHLLKMFDRVGGDPRLWLDIWSRSKGVQEHDRVMHELRSWIELFYLGGVYDQLNMSSLAAFETAARRVQCIVDAYHLGADKQDWGNSKLFTEVRSADNLVSPALKTWAARKGKEEVEFQKARHQAKELMKPGGGTYALEAAAGAVAGGGLPDGGKGRGRGKERGRGRGLTPPADP